jgi:poly-gamma-glutamate synthesis protein (capsule biosynthesis protein)
VQENISALREQGAQLVVCAFHWGQENTFRTIPNQENYGHLAIDSGADIVWGHHPHVLQPMESYNGGLIMYSLGNFVFGGNSAPKDYDTAIVQQEVILDVDGTAKLGEVTIIPCSVSSSRPNNYQPTPYEKGSKEYSRVLTKLDGSYTGGSLPIG